MSLTSYRAAPPRANSGRRCFSKRRGLCNKRPPEWKGRISQDCRKRPSYNCRMVDKPGLRPQTAVGNALRDVARHILAEGRSAVEDRQRIEAVAVHDFRAAMKSWRAYLRLI